MLKFYGMADGVIKERDSFAPGCWVNIINPSEEELQFLYKDCGLDAGFVRSALDEEETSRIEVEDDQILIIVDTPLTQLAEGGLVYTTAPLGLIFTETNLYTVSLKENSIVAEFVDGQVKGADIGNKNRFMLMILLRITARFHQYLRQIDKISSYVERQLHKSMRNKELIQLMELQKSLVYFSTSLKADELTLEKILRGRIIKMFDDDLELLEDVLIEVKQAIEMSNIYSQVLTGTMDAFASIISNNLNIVMKVLTAITILLSIPNVITSAYGMNVELPIPYFWFVMLTIGIAVGIAALLLKKHGMFR